MPNTSLRRRLDSALLALQLASQGQAVQYDKVIVSSSPDKKTTPDPVDETFSEWADRASRLVWVLEGVVAGCQLSLPSSASDLKNRVRTYPGRAAGWVAFAECTTVERVVAARTALGVNPEDGLPKPKALTSRELPDVAA
jgi:hypothetical protein